MTVTSDLFGLKPLPVKLSSVPKDPDVGDTDERVGVVEGEKMKEQFRVEQLEGIEFTVTVT